MRNNQSAPFIIILMLVSLSCNDLTPEYPSLEVKRPILPKPTGTLTASKISLPYGGGRVKLTWESKYADYAFITPQLGKVTASGDTTIHLKETTTFILMLVSREGKFGDSVTVSVSPTYEFIYPLAVGNTWTYRYYYDYGEPGCYTSVRGIHVWTTLSADTSNDSITYTLQSVNTDTVNDCFGNGVSHYSPFFKIIISPTSIYSDWTRTLGQDPECLINLDRFPTGRNDTVGNCRSTYINGVGMVSYWNYYFQHSYQLNEGLTLIADSLNNIDDSKTCMPFHMNQ